MLAAVHSHTPVSGWVAVCKRQFSAFAAEVERLRTAANGGDAESMVQLADALFKGEGVARDFDAALTWAKKASDSKHERGRKLLGEMLTSLSGMSGVDDKLLQRCAELGSPRAAYNLAVKQTMQQKPAESLRWLRLAASANHVRGMSMLAVHLFAGLHAPADPPEALRLWQRAASQGDELSRRMVAHLQTGDRDTVAKMCRAALGMSDSDRLIAIQRNAAIGDPGSMVRLGECYQTGQFGAKVDPAAAAHWFQRAAEKGSAAGVIKYADHLLTGTGVPRNERAGMELLRRAATEGADPMAMRALAAAYQTGTYGVERDGAGCRVAQQGAARAGRQDQACGDGGGRIVNRSVA